MSEPVLRVAVVGAGFVAPHHVDAVRRGGYGEVVVLAGRDPGRLAARSHDLGIERWTTDVTGLMRDPSIDIIHVCTPNASHVELASAALEAGKHVVVEKPLALDAASAGRLAELAARVGRHAMVAFTYRGYPMVRRARDLIGSGTLGELRLAHGSYLQDWLSRAEDFDWRVDLDAAGPSRALGDIGSHWLDTVEWVTGLRVESVMADLSTFIPVRRRPAGGEAVTVRTEDAAAVLVRFHGGARGVCLVSQVSPGRKNAFSIEIAGSQASLAWEQEVPERLWLGSVEDARVLVRTPGGAAPTGAAQTGAPGTPGVPSLPAGHPEGWGEALRDLFRPFYGMIAGGEPPPSAGDPAPYPTLADGARAVAFVDAALRSAREGRWAELRPT